MKPVAVDVVTPNIGVNATDSDVAVTCAVPLSVFSLVVLIVAVELVLAATVVTVTNPVPLTTTVPDDVADPAHV